MKSRLTVYIRETQPRQAFRSGLSHYFGKPEYKLYDPEHGQRLSDEELYQPRFNRFRCYECPMAFTCTGCHDCGKCKDVELVPLDAIIRPEYEDV